MHSRVSRLVLAASVPLWAGCKKSSTQPPTQTSSISVTAASPTLSVAQGAAATSAITVGRVGFSGDVVLTAENLPNGVTATFTPATLTTGATASSLSLAASGTADLGPATVRVRARGTGVTDATATIALTVGTVAGGAVSISVNPATATIVAGQTTQTVVAITRTGGFTGGVNLTVTGAPSGMTTTFSSANPVTGNSVNLTVATQTSTTPGPQSLTVRANGAGLTEATATYVVTVDPPPSNSVTWRYCDPSLYPTWFAIQDGLTGSWQRITETSPGVFTFGYGQPQVGIATVTTVLGKTTTAIRYFGLSEIPAAAAAECTTAPAPGTKNLTGSISGFGAATEIGLVSLGTALSSSTNSSQTSFTLNNVVNGPLDLIAVRADLVTSSALRVLFQRGLNPVAGSSLGTLDLSGGSSFAPGSSSITVTAPNDGPIQALAKFTTATGSAATFTTSQLSTGVAGTYQAIPAAQFIAGDVQVVQASQAVGTTISRFITRYIAGPAAVTLAMKPDPGAPTVTNVTGAPYARATASGSVLAEFNGLTSITFEQTTGSRIWRMVATAAGRTGTTNYSFTMPDFSAVAGWQNTWGLVAGQATVTSTFFGQESPLVGPPVVGTTTFSNGRQGTFTFP
jgi:hypothetical protein